MNIRSLILFFCTIILSGYLHITAQQPVKADTVKALPPILMATVTDTIPQDSVPKLPYSFSAEQQGSLFLNNINQEEVIYDPETDRYIFVQKIGDYYVKSPRYMTKKEYEEYRLKRDMIDYFKEKVTAVGGNAKNKELAQRDLLPTYYVKSSFFENVFGGDEIEVNPQGSVLVKMGILFQKVDNPQLSERNRQSTTFDFDQEINASLNAKVGKRLRVGANFDTQSTFNFQNQIKLEYTPTEDDIIRKIEVGNVSMPIQSSLISGAQNLFGVKTELQFGKTTVTGVFSQQRSQTRSVAAQGGATINEFELRASDYDENRHFFLSQSFRDDYNKALEKFPLITSSKYITRIEVWVTNRTNYTQDVRNIVAFADLGEADTLNIHSGNVTPVFGKQDPSNGANTLYANFMEDPDGPIRDIATLRNSLTGYEQGTDYSVLENARKLTLGADFTLNPQLGYITLNRRLAESDILAVAYEYTDSNSPEGTVFRVGELSSDGVTAPANLVVKLLRSEIVNTKIPMWRLMMKNIYALPGAYQLNSDGFRLEVLYQDDQEGVPLNILQNAVTSDEVKITSLLRMMRLDRLDVGGQVTPLIGDFYEGDGFFDFLPGITVDPQNGLIIFPTVEPFGSSVEATDFNTQSGELGQILTAPADNYLVFDQLYNLTKAQAKNEYQNKDKYFLKGYFKSESSNGIPLGAFNVPRGSVKVTSGGRELIEGVDYVVEYTNGTVQIIDPNLIASNAPINVSVENNNGFNQQRRSFVGVDVQHVFNENMAIGGTILNLNEKPFTPKYQFGSEPVNNTIIGFNFNYQTEVPKFTKWVNKLPNIDTEVASHFSIRAEAAYLLPGSPKGINLNGEAATYIDDFEGSQIPLDISSPRQWFLASTPQIPGGADLDFSDAPVAAGLGEDLKSGAERAKLAWYTIDRLFYGGNLKPDNIDDAELSRDEVRRVSYSELFPELELDVTQANIVNTFDLAYYPNERGPNNFNSAVDKDTNFFTDGRPNEKWGGIMRSLTTTDFQQANIEYIQFWLMDPYENYSITPEEGARNVNLTDFGGDIYLNLGNISEDILKDGRKMFENGLPGDGNQINGVNIDETAFSNIPKMQSLLYAFSEKDDERPNQDLGLDGMSDSEEVNRFGNDFGDDPSNDNYKFFRGGDLDASDASILYRYRNYNNTQGNSPTANNSTESFPTSATPYPDIEDINKDQTMSAAEAFFQYKVSLFRDSLKVGVNNIVDRKELEVKLPNDQVRKSVWYQFRIPVSSGTPINDISDFNSIRFMRIFLTNFKVPVVLRFGELQLVRGDWRRYTKTLDDNIEPPIDLTATQNQQFEVGVVNIQENERRQPIPYVLPPGVRRERLQGTTTVQQQNEQSLVIRVNDLAAGQTRAVYKNTSFDLRMFNTLRMFIHAESITGQTEVHDDEMLAIIRLGSDTDDNYYQIELPLKITNFGTSDPQLIWPSENDLEADLKAFGALKIERLNNSVGPSELYPSLAAAPDARLRVKGNPNLSNIRTLMLGVRNNTSLDKSAELWFNELRLTDFDNKGGWAAVVNADANFADFADVSISGRANSQGFGSLEQRAIERSQEDVKMYDVVTNVNLGQLLPKKTGIRIPFNYSIAEEFRDPKWDPKFQDVLFEDAKEANDNSNNSRDYTKRKSINFINVRKERTNSEKKQHFYDVENFSVSYSYSENYHHDYNVKKYLDQNVRASANYNYNFKPKTVEPLKNWKFLGNSAFLALLRDFNFNYLPNSISVNSNIIRNYNEQLSRPLSQSLAQIDLPTLTQRRFMFNWDYNIAYNLTKSLQFTFQAANNNIRDNFVRDSYNKITNGGIFNEFFSLGRPEHYHQTLDATYRIPINKIPWFDFITPTYSYTADFDWQSAAKSYIDAIGNTIQNANTHTFNADLDMMRLYQKTGILDLAVKKQKKQKKDKNAKDSNAKLPPRPSISNARAGTRQNRKKMTSGQKIVQGLVDVVTSVKKIRVAYSENNSTLLPGYQPETGFLGRDIYKGGFAPTMGFVFGSQRDIRSLAAANNWLVARTSTNEDYYSRAYATTHFEKLDLNADVRPFKDLSLELTANKVYAQNQTQQIDIVEGETFNPDKLPMSETGNFSMSYFMLPMAFDGNGDATFEKFKQNREIIRQRLASKYASQGAIIDNFGTNSQEVLIPAFLATYSGQDAGKIKLGALRSVPIPNWRFNYKGFMNFAWFKKHFRSFIVEHAYQSSYSIMGYNNNLLFNNKDPFNPEDLDANKNYRPQNIYNGLTLTEALSPLIKVDFRLQNSLSFKAELRTDKTLNLNTNNNTLTEIRGKEYVAGIGYRIPDVRLKIKTGERITNFKGDINVKADFSIRNNATVIRSIDIENNQVTGGQKLFSFKLLADYALNKNLLASFFYDHDISKFLISTNFPRKSINAGITLRYTIGN